MEMQMIPERFQTLTIYDLDGFTSKSLHDIELAEVPHVTLEKEIVQKIFRDLVPFLKS